MWITTQELLGLPLMPKTTQGIGLRAKQENWERRRKAGVKGNVFEYHLTSLPPETQRAIKLAAARTLKEKAATFVPERKQTERYLSTALWQPFNKSISYDSL